MACIWLLLQIVFIPVAVVLLFIEGLVFQIGFGLLLSIICLWPWMAAAAYRTMEFRRSEGPFWITWIARIDKPEDDEKPSSRLAIIVPMGISAAGTAGISIDLIDNENNIAAIVLLVIWFTVVTVVELQIRFKLTQAKRI